MKSLLPRKRWPFCIKVVTSGCHVKLDLVELIKMTDYVSGEMTLQEWTASVIPVTEQEGNQQRQFKLSGND